MRANRLGMPQDLAVRRPGDIDYRRLNQVVALVWRDKRDVRFLTTRHGPQTQVVRTRRGVDKVKPAVAVDYTKNMSGVDLSDQLVSYRTFHFIGRQSNGGKNWPLTSSLWR